MRSEDSKTIALTGGEADLMHQLVLEDARLQKLLHSSYSIRITDRTISARREGAVALREYFSDRFNVVGLDIEYKPTPEGRLLESLIDKLFWPEDE